MNGFALNPPAEGAGDKRVPSGREDPATGGQGAMESIMRLMRESEVPVMPSDRVFRASRLYAVLFVAATLSLSTVLVWPRSHRTPLPIFGGFILLALLVLRRYITSRFHPLNWLVRAGDQGLFLHFRSYLNEDYSPDDATVVFLAYSEIRSARLIRERVTTPDMSGANQTQFLKWIELELGVDPAPLSDALSTELERPAVMIKRWYGSSGTIYRDYPLQMQTPPFLRVRWNVVPRASVFLDFLRSRVEIAPTIKVSGDFSNLQYLTRADQEKRLRELNQRGDTIAAVYAARKLYGLDLTEATNFVKGLSGGPPS